MLIDLLEIEGFSLVSLPLIRVQQHFFSLKLQFFFDQKYCKFLIQFLIAQCLVIFINHLVAKSYLFLQKSI